MAIQIKQENESTRYKARLVAKGFTQKEGIEFTEIFSPVVKYTTVRIILALTAHFNWELKQMDVKTAFLHGDLDETIYMSQPDGFISDIHPDHVCLLKKSLYGLKQSPRQWNKKFDLFMQSLKFQRSAFDPCLYFKYYSDIHVFLVLYVDNMLIASFSITLIVELQNNLSKNFEMKNLGDAKKILGMTIERNRKTSTIFLNQKSYVKNVVENFSMTTAKPTPVPLAAHFQLCKNQSPNSETEKERMKIFPYSNAIGSVMYLMVSTRPDIAYAVSCLSKFMSNAGMPHWEALKWLLRYLNGSMDIGIIFSKLSDDVKLVGLSFRAPEFPGNDEAYQVPNPLDLVQGGIYLRGRNLCGSKIGLGGQTSMVVRIASVAQRVWISCNRQLGCRCGLLGPCSELAF
ncbi:UNVERIFIED_CONTAM: Retrovirus-related Pol polyprotein from transposon TNT 1-94 [Sesamum latifolium]|uniref:Retrovirus-related Pol polyprotein from transposon TNT 1-94 n=1 Tax=Sesamum latifolium TaxID=2727402 RepID=A0AAW2XYH3_9LAMI